MAYAATLVIIFLALLWAVPTHVDLTKNIDLGHGATKAFIASASQDIGAGVARIKNSVRDSVFSAIRNGLHQAIDATIK